MAKHPDVRDATRAKHKYVLCDEFQDTNIQQCELLALLVGDSGRLTVVGDDDQSIFSFQGANDNVFTALRKRYPAAQTVRLGQNYRSTQVIVAASSAVIQRNAGREGKAAVSMKDAGERIQAVACLCEANEAEYVLGRVAAERARGTKLSEMAILFRKTTTGRFFQQRLLDAGVAFNKHGPAFYRRKRVKTVVNLLRVAADPADDMAFEDGFKAVLEAEQGVDMAGAKKLSDHLVQAAERDGVPQLAAARAFAQLKQSSKFPKPRIAAVKSAVKFVDMLTARMAKADLPELVKFATSRETDNFWTTPVCQVLRRPYPRLSTPRGTPC
jgi:DNA helicase-2/ATP-dependent DNA helicase PcrA